MLAKSYLERLRSEAAYYKFQTERGKRYKEILSIDLTGKSVLEVGCGYGGIISAFNSALSVGIDIGEKLISRASNLSGNPGAVFMIGDATRMPYKDQSFDIVLLLDVLEHVSVPEKLVRESARILKRDGTLCVNFASYRTAFGGHLILPYIHYLPKNIAYSIVEAFLAKIETPESRRMFDMVSVKQQHEMLNRVQTKDILKMLMTYFTIESSIATTIIRWHKLRGNSIPDFLCISRFYICKK